MTEQAAAVSEAESLLQKNADAKGAKVGLTAGVVGTTKVDYSLLLKAGLAVKIHNFCPTFETKIDPEDFGIILQTDEEREAWRRNVNAGDIGLLPEKQRRKITNIKNRRVQWHGKFANEIPSFDFGDVIKLGDAENGREEGWNFREWLDGDDKMIAQYNEVRQDVHDHWDDMMATMRREYRLIGIGVYARLKDTEDAARARAVQRGEPEPQSRLASLEDFLEVFVNKRMAKVVGKRDEFTAGMSMTREIRDIPLASQMAEDQAQAEQILLEKAKVESELSTLERIKLEKIKTAREEAREGVQTLMADLKASVNGEVFRVARNVLKAIQDNGEVPGGSVKGVRNLVENIQRLLIVPDEQIEAQMREVKRLLARESLNDDIGDVQTVMKRIASEAKLVLLQLDRKVDSTRDVGVPDTLMGLQRVTGVSREGVRTETMQLVPMVTGVERNGTRDI